MALLAISAAIRRASMSPALAMVQAEAAPITATRLSWVGSDLSTRSPEVWYQRSGQAIIITPGTCTLQSLKTSWSEAP